MGDDPNNLLNRRKLLKYSSAAGMIALAGCEEVQLDTPTATPDTTPTATPAPQAPTLVQEGPTVGLEVAAEGLTSPNALTTAPGQDDTRYIVDQPGVIYEHDSDGNLGVFMNITDRVIELDPGFDERGLLGLAFHPDYQDNGLFYVRYSAELKDGLVPDSADPSNWDHTSVVAEFQANADRTAGDPTTERKLMEYAQPQFNHNAGPLAFGPDGYLYIATGDGGDADDTGPGHMDDWYADNDGGNGQNTSDTFLGGMLRIDVDNQDEGLEYAIPSDNPLVGMDGHREEYYAWGMRNPWGMAFDSQTGELLAADVGQNLIESVNRVEKGGNYGWNVKEGTQCFSTDTPNEPPASCPQMTPDDVRGGESLRDPVFEYPHNYGEDQVIGVSITGGDMYRTDTVPELQDSYVFGDWSAEPAGKLMMAHPPDGWETGAAADPDFQDQTDGYDSDLFDESKWDGLWQLEEILVDGPDSVVHDQDPNRLADFVLAVERDHSGDMYILTNDSAGPSGSGGKVLKIVPPGDATDADPATIETVELDAFSDGWVGTSPDGIAGETNPTLEFRAGNPYRVIWTNADGAPHDFAVLDGDGNRLVGTEIDGEQGASHTLVFEGSEEMAGYYCSVHPNAMRGSVHPPTLVQEGPTVGLEVAAEGLTSPTALTTAPGEMDTRYVLDQPGVIHEHDSNGAVSEFMNITDRVIELDPGFDERGLLGLAFHPNYQDNGLFYVRYSAELKDGLVPDSADPSNWDHTSVVAEFQANADRTAGDPTTERRILEYAQPQFNHNAGPLAFGPDGYLYIATGDGGDADDTGPGHMDDWYADNAGGNGQNTSDTLLGGMLRIDVDNTDQGLEYAIPSDNPLVGMDGHREEYYAWGMRNPWQIAFDSQTDELLVADVGQNLIESVIRVEKGGNYGWNVKEGTQCFSTDTPNEPPASCPQSTPDSVRGGESLRDPVFEYPHNYGDQLVGVSISGGDMYRTDTVPELQDSYVFGDWSAEPAGRLFVATPPDGWETGAAADPDLQDQTDGYDSDLFDESKWDGLWQLEEVLVDGPDSVVHDQDPNRLADFVLAVERDHSGDMYVLTNDSFGPTGSGGKVLKIVSQGT
jgi:glucose/arabinose dehydrogenase